MVAALQSADPPRIGPYRLVGVLGAGGMGRVYLGRSPGGIQVAIKVIKAEAAAEPQFRARFAREVAAARRVNGLYTAVVVGADPDAPQPWLATTYINAPSLADLVAQKGPLPAGELRSLAAGLAEGLAAIHAADLVHRDLKPSNVLITPDGPKIIDFGITLATDLSSLTGSNTIIGTPGYMSPEQVQAGREVGPASDIFSLGATLCFAAAGRTPWGSGSQLAMLFRVVHEEPDLVGVTGEIQVLLERCLVKDPARRPAAADILAEFGESGLPDDLPGRPIAPLGTTLADGPTALAPTPGPAHPTGRGASPSSVLLPEVPTTATAARPTGTAKAVPARPGESEGVAELDRMAEAYDSRYTRTAAREARTLPENSAAGPAQAEPRRKIDSFSRAVAGKDFQAGTRQVLLPPRRKVRFRRTRRFYRNNRTWGLLTAIMVTVGGAAEFLTESWELALTLTILIGIAGTIYLLRNARYR